MVYPDNGILFTESQWSTDTFSNVDEIFKHYAKVKKVSHIDYTVYDSVYLTYPEVENL